MPFVLVIGLGIQGKKRQKVLNQLKIKSISLDSHVSNADFKRIDFIPKKILIKVTHVFICTPYENRLFFLKFFIKSNVKILIEKPLITNNHEKIFLKKNFSKIKKKFYVAYNHRFEESIQKCKEIIEKKKIGNLYFCKMVYGNGTAKNIKESKWKNSGKGVIMDLLPHLLDLSFFIFKSIPKKINRYSKLNFENKSPDYFEIETEINKLNISLNTSYLYWRNNFKIFIVGSKGFIELTGLPKWGISKLKIGKRKLPSGRPQIKNYRYKSDDLTWKKEINNFIYGNHKIIELKKDLEIFNFIKKC
jgi:scyllo-inositol 2-dehydrogenase (NADP+)